MKALQLFAIYYVLFKKYAAIWFCVVKKVESRYETLLILIFDVHHGVQQVLEVYESTCNRFLFKNNYELRFHMALKKSFNGT